MKTISAFFFFCSVLIAGTVLAQAQKTGLKAGQKPVIIMENKKAMENVTEDRFRGRWKETKRRRLDNGEYLAFKDTMLVEVGENESIIKATGSAGRTIKGSLEITASGVIMAGYSYSVGKITNEEWILYEENLERTLFAVQEFPSEKNGASDTPDYSKTEIPVLKNLEGAWTVYRREGPPDLINADSYLIEYLELNPANQKDVITGTIRFTEKNIPVTKDLQIFISADPGRFIMEAGTKQWQMSHFRGDGKEWIFGQPGGVIYKARR